MQQKPIPATIVRLFFTVEALQGDKTRRFFHFEHQKFSHEVDDNFIMPESWIDRFNENKAKVSPQFSSLATVRSLKVTKKTTHIHLRCALSARVEDLSPNRNHAHIFEGRVAVYNPVKNQITVFTRTPTNATIDNGV
ncbi:MAG: hypothetical protein EZS28_056637, partial [Streblomastix strix]